MIFHSPELAVVNFIGEMGKKSGNSLETNKSDLILCELRMDSRLTDLKLAIGIQVYSSNSADL